jgi:hypothetical protein
MLFSTPLYNMSQSRLCGNFFDSLKKEVSHRLANHFLNFIRKRFWTLISSHDGRICIPFFTYLEFKQSMPFCHWHGQTAKTTVSLQRRTFNLGTTVSKSETRHWLKRNTRLDSRNPSYGFTSENRVCAESKQPK